ncbi:kinase, PfkB family [Corynebacterium efficiens YS-314]|uniref:Putative phosphofructokinase n=1 Tax=Corynebacterium efficiens (strain DSM 44549 / YS-314 / AJ 12310 / JCM 11189 / NBRC 100395) TaxID=196164 RepID=Q8FPF3_COREF|nr:1-phosphofructokinase family hexose kinase [Corynebacterium efficiens]EEW49479.1 kinase, PfkB family [Corynebacterium efficiens YS-314]BAC18635.1 putative phosphofructokinase [Corynebacterium efficiens YS-314]
MILTVTASPYLLSTNDLSGPIEIGGVNAMSQAATVAGGFGAGVANTLFLGGMETLSIFPAPEISHYLRLVKMSGLPYEIIPVAGPIPMHLTMRDQEGAETEFKNSPMPLDVSQLAMLRDLVVRKAEDADWVLLGGELPSIAPAAWFVDVVRSLTLYHPQVRVAISTTGAPLRAVIRQLAASQPHLLVLTGEDLEISCGKEPGELKAAWSAGDITTVVDVARGLIDRGISELLITVNRGEAIHITGDDVYVASFTGTPGKQGVSWRESFVAGFLSAAKQERSPEEQLSYAVAYANATGSEWDNFIPTPDRVSPREVTVVRHR